MIWGRLSYREGLYTSTGTKQFPPEQTLGNSGKKKLDGGHLPRPVQLKEKDIGEIYNTDNINDSNLLQYHDNDGTTTTNNDLKKTNYIL